jgi:glycosyltransferase involved in cell wall biosynthesis
MKILVVHETEYIKKVVFEYQIIPEIWASEGHDVYVVDFETTWKRKNIFDLISKTQVLKNVRRAGKEKGITLIRPGYVKIPALSRLTASISHYFAIKWAIREYKIDVIFLYSVPTNGLQAVYLARKYKIPIHFRLLDVLHQLVPYKILSKPAYLMEKIVYRRVDELTAITPKLTKYAIALGAREKTASYLPTGPDDNLFRFAPRNKGLMKKLSLKQTDKIIVFAGTLYNFSGLDKILNYYAKHKRNYRNLKFLIIGHGQQEEELKSIVKTNNLSDSVIFTGFIQYEKLSDYLNLADICINPFEINKITDIIFPSKIYQYLACRKPVIATRLPGLIDLFPDDKGKNNIYYFDLEHPKEFFALLGKITRFKTRKTDLSLKDIARILENKLMKLKAKS